MVVLARVCDCFVPLLFPEGEEAAGVCPDAVAAAIVMEGGRRKRAEGRAWATPLPVVWSNEGREED